MTQGLTGGSRGEDVEREARLCSPSYVEIGCAGSGKSGRKVDGRRGSAGGRAGASGASGRPGRPAAHQPVSEMVWAAALRKRSFPRYRHH